MPDSPYPKERCDLPGDTDSDDVLRKLLESDGTDAVSEEPEDVEDTDS